MMAQRQERMVTKVQDGIELYEVVGTALDNAWLAKNRDMLEDHAVEDMRDNGLIPVLDISPGLSSCFLAEQEIFEFRIHIYGFKVGKEKSREYLGILINDGLIVNKDATHAALFTADI